MILFFVYLFIWLYCGKLYQAVIRGLLCFRMVMVLFEGTIFQFSSSSQQDYQRLLSKCTNLAYAYWYVQRVRPFVNRIGLKRRLLNYYFSVETSEEWNMLVLQIWTCHEYYLQTMKAHSNQLGLWIYTYLVKENTLWVQDFMWAKFSPTL